jgi:acyl-CoA synthetase (AMP-forming)/AMP-acid ligase II
MENINELITADPILKQVQWVLSDDLPNSLDFQNTQPDITENTPAFIQYTSGSTSSPKGVILNHKHLLSNLKTIETNFGLDHGSVGGIWLPPYHDMGLIGGLLTPIYTSFPVVLMSPFTFLQRPIKWLQMITDYKVTCSGGPNFAYQVCVNRIKDSQLDELDLSSWDLAFTGAEPIQEETLLRFSEKFKVCGFNQQAIYPCYGLAEYTLIASGVVKGHGYRSIRVDVDELEINGQAKESDTGRSYISNGKPTLGTQIKIVHPETFAELSEGLVGEIWISGPSISGGYWNREEATRETFGRSLAGASDSSFLRTGDIGFLKDGELYVTGRQKDLIIYNGRNIYPQDIEKTVQSLNPALKMDAGAAFGLENSQGSENVVIVQEVDRKTAAELDYDHVAAQIKEAILEAHGIPVLGISFIKMNSIPLTSSGKIQRHVCKKLFLSNGLVELKRITYD